VIAGAAELKVGPVRLHIVVDGEEKELDNKTALASSTTATLLCSL
jgi:hypothetical protein